jgi:hypothetical protein
MHMELLCAYAHFKSGMYNAHPTVSCFFTDEPSHLLYDIAGQVGRWWEGSSIKSKALLDEHWSVQIKNVHMCT